ncbi:hypothetical protein FBQ96_08795 [Nitrospirales bacterium NOB]|nr:hypothetical protein [Nitrospirales bacterium NOB]
MSRNGIGRVISAFKITMPLTPSKDAWGRDLMELSNSIELYCDKCQKVTVWVIVSGRNSTNIGFFSVTAMLEGWAEALFLQYGICTECESRNPYQDILVRH